MSFTLTLDDENDRYFRGGGGNGTAEILRDRFPPLLISSFQLLFPSIARTGGDGARLRVD